MQRIHTVSGLIGRAGCEMDRSARLLLLIFLLAIPSSSTLIKQPIECSRVQRNSTCFIEGVSFHSTDDEYPAVFPTASHIIIEASEILHFAPHLFDALAETAFLTLKGSLIPAVTFRSDELHSLRIENTKLREFTVAAEENRNLNTLIISGNPLSVIPPTVHYLTGLSILDLSNNQLQYVQLSWFQPMENLLVLDLSANRITRIDVHPSLRLGRLKNFWANHNQLRHIAHFPHFAPSLRRVRLVENHWSCEWVAQVRVSIWTFQIQVYGAENVCPDVMDGGLCCYEGLGLNETNVQLESAAYGGERRLVGETFPRAESLVKAREEPREEDQRKPRQSCDVLEQKYRRLVEEKEQLDRRFVNTIRELERTVKRLTAELTDAQDRVRSQHLTLT